MIRELEKSPFEERLQVLVQQYQLNLQRFQQAQKDQVEARDAMLRCEGAIQALTELREEIWETPKRQE